MPLPMDLLFHREHSRDATLWSFCFEGGVNNYSSCLAEYGHEAGQITGM